jgi:hypothetical protein
MKRIKEFSINRLNDIMEEGQNIEVRMWNDDV